jgi:hypothetical protein
MSHPVVLVRIIHARLLVGALGECLGWWPSKFTTPAGQRNLRLVLPRSWQRAVLESVTLAAREHHDRSVPTDAVHLFRLGTAHEDAIAHHLAGDTGRLEMPPDNPDAILATLRAFGARTPDNVGPGPLYLGAPTKLREHATINTTAGAYTWCATSNAQTIPYFRAGA